MTRIRIKIIKVPPGNPPEWVRQAWVGMTLESIGKEGEVQPFDHPHYAQEGFAPYRDGDANAGGYQVRAHQAVIALDQARKHEASAWWKSHMSWSTAFSSIFIFAEDCCEVHSPGNARN